MADLTYYGFTRPSTLAVDLNNTTTTVQLTDGSSYPDPSVPGNGQYTVILGYGTEREEVVTVTGKPSGSTLTVIRGQDGSAALAQNAGDIVVHGVSARDFRGSVQSTGDTMTGPLILDADATVPLEAVPLQQVEEIVAAAIRAALPVGSTIDYGGSTAPAGWHLCDGTAHGSAELEAILGSPNTPDLRDKFTMAAGPVHARGTSGGADTVTLTAAQSGLVGHAHGASSAGETQEHTHSVNPPATNTGTQSANHVHSGTTGAMNQNAAHGHTNYIREGITTGDSNAYVDTADAGDGTTRDNIVVINATNTDHLHGFTTGGNNVSHLHAVDIATFTSGGRSATHTHGVTVNAVAAAGATQAHDNLPPFYAMTKIMKVS